MCVLEMNLRRVIYRGSQFHEIDFMKLETVVSSKNAVVLNSRSHTESHETIVAQLLFHMIMFVASNLKQRHFSMKQFPVL
jgi:hypothetical protein